MWVQIILIVAILGIAIYLVRSTPSARHLALRRLLLFVLLVAAIVIVLAPGWLSAIAHALGIGRGTDLLLYGAIIFFLLYAASEYKRSIQTSRVITLLSRELALTREKVDELVEKSGSKPATTRKINGSD